MAASNQALPAPALEGRLRVIQRRVSSELRREFPELAASTTVVAVSRKAKVSALAEEATRLVGSSCESGEALAISRG
ncbi:MAG: hypothetical protein J6D54_08840 [Olsenella sp.]|nr:hypothetical protein [Olsenella sp.]